MLLCWVREPLYEESKFLDIQGETIAYRIRKQFLEFVKILQLYAPNKGSSLLRNIRFSIFEYRSSFIRNASRSRSVPYGLCYAFKYSCFSNIATIESNIKSLKVSNMLLKFHKKARICP